jgi:TolB-like protein
MNTKASIVVMSHLSDAQEEMNNAGNRTAQSNINFAKYVILQTKGDLNQEIDGNAMYQDFLKEFSKTKEFKEMDINSEC